MLSCLQPRTQQNTLVIFGGVEDKSLAAFAAVLTIFVGSHEDTGATLFARAFAAKSVYLSVLIDLLAK
jgi:cyanophycinase-like exopeptidase